MPDTDLAKIVTTPFCMTWLEWLSWRYLLRTGRFDEAARIMSQATVRMVGLPARFFDGDSQYSSAFVEYKVAIERLR
jgi:hypothetical protein